MHIKSIVSDEDREELERMLSLGFIIPNQLFKTRQKSRMIIYIFTPVEFLLSINCYLSESYLMFGIGIGTCVACVAWIIWYQMIGKNFEKNVHEFVWGRSGYETVYGQLKELNFAKGDTPEAGQVLGYVSEPTKYYTTEGSNVYFQLKKDGKAVDPKEYLPQMAMDTLD